MAYYKNTNTGNWNTGNYNTGNGNTGDHNTGNGNTGDHNTGDWSIGNGNAGDYNMGDYNTGDWNKTNYSNGCFNTEEAKILMFNKPSPWTLSDWLNSEARRLMGRAKYQTLDWICCSEMTDEEKAEHPEAETTGGYLKELDNSECMVIWWHGLSDKERGIIMALPNFDKAIFREITGIDIDKD